MHRLAQAVNRLLQVHFFKAEAAPSLSLFRCLYCLFLFGKLWMDRHNHLAIFEGTAWYRIPLFELLNVPLMSVQAYQLLQYVLLAALALTCLGVFTRVSAAVACAAFFIYMGTHLGFGKSPHTNYVIHSHNIVVFVLFILAIAPHAGEYGWDGLRRRGWRWWPSGGQPALATAWPRQLIILTLALAYFGAGYCKIASHLLWADGYNLQAYLMGKHLLLDCPVGAWIADSYWLCLLLSIATLALELTFFLILFFPRLTWLYVLSAISFHAAVYLTMRINFFPYYGFTLLVFIDWPLVQRATAPLLRLVGQRGRLARRDELLAPSPRTLGDTRWARLAVLGIWGVLAVCILGRIESWPFTDYQVFMGRSSVDDVHIYRLALADGEGRRQWLPRGWIALSPTATNRRIRAHLEQNDQASLAHMLNEMASQVAACDTSRQARSLVIVERTLRSDPRTRGLEIVERSVARAEVQPAGDEPAAAFADRATPAIHR